MGSALNEVTNKFDESGPPKVRQVGVAVGKLIFFKIFSFFISIQIIQLPLTLADQ
jgi:hypothetical protein